MLWVKSVFNSTVATGMPFRNHLQNTVCYAIQLGVNFAQRAWGLKNIEMPVERYFIANLRLIVVKPALGFAHVTPIQADKMRRKTMKLITVALLINAVAELIAAFAKFINAIRQRR